MMADSNVGMVEEEEEQGNSQENRCCDCHGLIVMDNTLLHCTIDYSFVQFITVLHYNYAILYCIILYIVLYYTILYHILHYFTVVHYKMMYCIV